MIITNVPTELLNLTEALLVTRIRWQVELLFTLWKSHGRLDEWRTTKPARMLCELYAKLLALVFQQWILAASSWRDPERSLFKAADLVAQGAGDLAIASHDVDRLTQALEHTQPHHPQHILAMTLADVYHRCQLRCMRSASPATLVG